MEQKFVYTMKGLSKSFDSGQTVLNEIWLSFLLGAKIGVLGLNGAGKSTLLRVMAGQITAFEGEAFPADGISASVAVPFMKLRRVVEVIQGSFPFSGWISLF